MNAKTLILYDRENIKVPRSKSWYEVPFINIEVLFSRIKEEFPSLEYKFIVFAKDKSETDPKSHEKMVYEMTRLGIDIILKKPKESESTIDIDGKEIKYKYEECDMDGSIIHEMHKGAEAYDRIILISGDGDMYEPLKYIMEKFGADVIVISHKERLSSKYSDITTITFSDFIGEPDTKE